MKISTARRIIKENKRGKGAWTQEQVDRAHQVAHEYHDKVAAEKGIIEQFAVAAQEQAKAEGKSDEMVKVHVARAREHAAKQLKDHRQAAYRERVVPWKLVDVAAPTGKRAKKQEERNRERQKRIHDAMGPSAAQ